MAKLPLYAAGITASFTILLTAVAAQDAALLNKRKRFSTAPGTWQARSLRQRENASSSAGRYFSIRD